MSTRDKSVMSYHPSLIDTASLALLMLGSRAETSHYERFVIRHNRPPLQPIHDKPLSKRAKRRLRGKTKSAFSTKDR